MTDYKDKPSGPSGKVRSRNFSSIAKIQNMRNSLNLSNGS